MHNCSDTYTNPFVNVNNPIHFLTLTVFFSIHWSFSWFIISFIWLHWIFIFVLPVFWTSLCLCEYFLESLLNLCTSVKVLYL
jgi:hypothetical protein